ncbi:paraquat-inducible protein A [Mucilaginibacter sp.]
MTTHQHKSAAGKFGIANILVILGLGILLCGEAYCGFRLHTLSTERKQIKEDYSTINNITFGLFSVDQWRDKIATVVHSQVHDFKITPEQKKALQAEVSQALHSLVSKAVATINKPQTSFAGKLKKFAFNKFIDTNQIQELVPSFARTIINKVNSPASTGRLKDIATSKINQLEKETYDSTKTAAAAVDSFMYHKYHVSNNVQFDQQLKAQLVANRIASFKYSFGMLGFLLAVLVIWWLLRNQYHLKAILYVMSLLFAFVLITVGITTSIIEVDARIGTLNFILMDQKVSFDNQVLFFQSKSILGIVEVLLKQPKADAVLVGVLILVFVIVFPVLRLVFTGIHILSRKKFAENKIVRYFTFESGHWTMADVMIVGILMTYIGLNGILESQLSNLNIHNSFLTTATQNSTSLQFGYFVFVAFVLYSLVLTTIVKRITPYSAT